VTASTRLSSVATSRNVRDIRRSCQHAAGGAAAVKIALGE
jgi:hypothetical protein